jgi:hypothetical protein
MIFCSRELFCEGRHLDFVQHLRDFGDVVMCLVLDGPLIDPFEKLRV